MASEYFTHLSAAQSLRLVFYNGIAIKRTIQMLLDAFFEPNPRNDRSKTYLKIYMALKAMH